MENIEVELWQPIQFNETWAKCDISTLEDLTPSWFKRRQDLKDGNEDYEEFIERLKRQHAIETGVVEKLYDLSEGITETFIKDGFVESYLSHEDTNIPPAKLMSYLKDHFEAMDFIFDMVKNERPLTLSFIKQLHQLVTQHQDYTEAIDTLGRRIQVPLLKGEFKQADNNPRREDGRLFKYCPHLQVIPEMDILLTTTIELYRENINPLIISAWFHHAFTQIHPFQDGNGRMARLLASLILIKGGLFPLTIRRDEKVKYIRALEKADAHEPQDLVTLFCSIQKENIELALNYKSEKNDVSFEEVARLFTEKVEALNSRNRHQRQQELDTNRNIIFSHLYDLINKIKNELFGIVSQDKAYISIESVNPGHRKDFWYTYQIGEYSSTYNYYFNRHLPRGWFKISFKISENKRYDLIITLHHFGFDDSVVAVGAFLEYNENPIGEDEEEDKVIIPIQLKPFTISLEGNPSLKLNNLSHYVRGVVKVGLTIIANEIG